MVQRNEEAIFIPLSQVKGQNALAIRYVRFEPMLVERLDSEVARYNHGG